LRNLQIYNKNRIEYLGNMGNEKNGRFIIPTTQPGVNYLVLASDGLDWDHVSVSIIDDDYEGIKRCPTHEEMADIKRKFFDAYETTTQYHPVASDYINNHPYVLHWFRHQRLEQDHPFMEESTHETIEMPVANGRSCIVRISEDDEWQRINLALIKGFEEKLSAYPSWDDCCVIKEKLLGPNKMGFTLSDSPYLPPRKTPSIDIWHAKKEKIKTPPSIMVGFKEWNK